MTAVLVFCSLCLLLVIGKILRMNIPLLQRLYLPSSLVGGLVGLLLVSCFGSWIPSDLVSAAGKVPGFLINIVFATLFLGTALPKIGKIVNLAFPQLCIGQILAWGQYVVGLGLAGFVFVKFFGVPAAFGNLLEIGFEGGPGTVGGMAMVQWAYRRGIVKQVVSFGDRRRFERRGLFMRRSRPAAGRQTVSCDSIDSLAWHIAVIGTAVLIGYGLRLLIPMRGFPLFPLCMIGGVILQLLARAFRKDLLVDRGQMERISGASLDFLLVAAIATIKIRVIAANWLPLLVLIVAGTLWSVWVIMVLSPKIFREAWFERAIAEFGQATGVTATGLMLLRTVDPENRTPAAMSFGYKQLLHEPFMGGGIWTALAFTLVYQIGWLNVFWISLAMLVLWSAVAVVIIRRNKRT